MANGELAMAIDPLDTAGVLAAAKDEPWTGMPRGTVMGHVHLHVGDLETASRFYHDALGLDRIVSSYPGALFLSAGGYHHHLGVNTWAGRARSGLRARREAARVAHHLCPRPTTRVWSRSAWRRRVTSCHASRDGWLVTDPWGTPLRLAAG